MNTSAALTLADWQSAYRAGADPHRLLSDRRRRLAERGLPVYLHVIDDAALQAQLLRLQTIARQHPDIEARLAAHPLWGVPFVAKDNIDIAGVPTTAACPAFSRIPSDSATVVQRLLDAGAVWLAKTNLDQFATGLVGTRSPHGAPASAWSDEHISGGSSSGSAVAVATGDVPFSLGTDTAGSGRIPAGFNHVVGLKPTPGRVSTSGILPACRSLDCPSIFALGVADAATILAVIEGDDPSDPFSRFVPGPPAATGAQRIGVPQTLPAAVQPAARAAFDAACTALSAQGHTVVPIDFSVLHAVADLLYEGPWVAERHLVLRELLAREPQAVDNAVRTVVAQAERFDADAVFEAQYRLKAFSREAAGLWQQVDLLMVPTAPSHPRLAEVAAQPIAANSALGLYTNFVNLLGWSALALPASVSAQGLPQGVTFIAAGGHDAALAGFGLAWQTHMAQPLGATGRPASTAGLPTGPAPAAEPTLALAVVGAHLSGLPLNHQLTDLGATRVQVTATAAEYRLFALPGTRPAKPGLLRVAEGGASIAVEVWAVPMAQVGRFLAGIPSPLGLGTVKLQDGQLVHGFLCESLALSGAEDISQFGGWRNYVAAL